MLLEVEGLKKYFPLEKGFLRRQVDKIKAVDGVSFRMEEAETLGLVGESGCGKSTLGRLLLKLIEPTAGKIQFGKAIELLRRDTQIIFQDPYGSLDPKMRIRDVIGEPLIIHGFARGKRELIQKVRELLSEVGLNPDDLDRFPHEFSSGQRQRIGVARALSTRPKLIVCDEPVASLDVSVQAQILNLLLELQEKFGLAYFFIAHDLRVIEAVSDRVMVMYLGKIMEMANSRDLYALALHPYTKTLLQAATAKPVTIEGELSQEIGLCGCVFRGRCPRQERICREIEPELIECAPSHLVACHFPL